MYFYHKKIKKVDIGEGIVLQDFAKGQNLNVLHWNMKKGSIIKLHSHPQEQFGYVIKGGFKMIIGNKRAILKAGDAYIIPPNVQHEFIAIDQTEAIDVFSPIKKDFPWKK